MHLRHLAGEISPVDASSDDGKQVGLEISQPIPPEPVYDRIRFGDQESLVKALKEQPSSISLNQLLRSLADKENNNT